MLPYPPRFALPNLNCGELRNLALFSEFKVKFAKPPIKKQKSRSEEEPAEWRRKRPLPLILWLKATHAPIVLYLQASRFSAIIPHKLG